MKKETITIIHNAVTAMVVRPSQDVLMQLNSQLSFEVAGHEHMGSSNWNGRNSFFNSATGKFPSGFVRLIRKRFEREGHKVVVKSKEAPPPLGPENPKVDDFPEDPRYAYQYEVVRRLVTLKGMIARIATGGGKSRVFKMAAERIGRPTLFVTTRKSLMYQMAESYKKDIGKPMGIMGDGKWEPVANGVNFAIIDTLISRIDLMCPKAEFRRLKEMAMNRREKKIVLLLKKAKLNVSEDFLSQMPKERVAGIQAKITQIRKAVVAKMPIDSDALRLKAETKTKRQNINREKLLKFLATIEFVCLEEAHEVSSSSYYTVMNACTNAYYRLALTATPFMKDDEEANMRLMAVTGTVGIKVTEKQLIDSGILAKPYFKYESYKRPKKVFSTTSWQSAQAYGIVENVERNQKIYNNCADAYKHGLAVMILVQLTRHGKLLEKALAELGYNVKFISGETTQKQRQAALDDLAAGRIDILIGSTILDVGVDVPCIGMVILAGGGKAEVAIRQRVGRGLRAKAIGVPNVAFIVDFKDGHNKHLTKHARERRKVIEDTPGFGENIVKDFNLGSFGFGKAL
jgi:superfamily II DNA or RNA helicase